MLKIEGLNLVLVGLTASIPLIAPFFPLLKDFFSSTVSRVIKERSAIEELRSNLDSLLNKEKYIQDINVLKSRTVRKITFEQVNILLRKDINLMQLIDMSEITKKGLCLYVPASKEIQLVSRNNYEATKEKDKYLLLCFNIFVLLVVALVIDIVFFQEIVSMTLLFFSTLFFEVIWLVKRSPYESYKELTKNEESINELRNQGIIVAQTITS